MATIEQRVKAAIRRKILQGAYGPEDRISEVVIAQELDASRTPVRAALVALEAEGLIEKRKGRGYVANQITPESLMKGFQVKSALEGMAARYMAEYGMSDDVAAEIEASLAITESIATAQTVRVSDIDRYMDANVRFHKAIMYGCDNEFIVAAYERLQHFPMLGLGAVVFDASKLEKERLHLTVGHAQHTIVYHAIKDRHIARAELNMREHSSEIVLYARLFRDTEFSAEDLISQAD